MTLVIFDAETTKLGEQLRAFLSKTCPVFDTRELHREARARKRRQAKENSAAEEGTARKPKAFNLNTYKTHSLGDYYEMICRLGTTDSYSTEPVCGPTSSSSVSLHSIPNMQGELEHRTPKGRYKRTSKKAFKMQLTQIERRQARIRQIHQRVAAAQATNQDGNLKVETHSSLSTDSGESLANDPAVHHHIGKAENIPVHIGTFLRTHVADPAITV